MSKKLTPEANENLQLWTQVCKTDPAFTRPVKLGGRSFTTVCAQYQIQNATSQFGPMGQGWGITDEKFTILEKYNLAMYTGTLFYSINGKGGAIPLHSAVRLTDSKGNADSDFAKKAATDALTKGLSKLGFNADIFLGLYDDNKYYQQMLKEFKDTEPDKASASHAATPAKTPASAPKVSEKPETPNKLPAMTTEEVKCMNRLWDWASKVLPTQIAPQDFKNLVYACLARWPSTQLDEQHIKNTLSTEQAPTTTTQAE